MAQVLFRVGDDFEAEAFASGHFESEDQIRVAAVALERAGFLTRTTDQPGPARFRVTREITDEDLAFATAVEHKRHEEGA